MIFIYLFKPNNNEPIHNQLVVHIKQLILSGTYASGEKLIPVREWSEALKINPNTLQKALQVLEDEKLIVTKSTIGKFVTTDVNLIQSSIRNVFDELTKKYLCDIKSMNISKDELIERIKKQYDKDDCNN